MDLLYLTSLLLSIAVTCPHYLDLLCGWSSRTNLTYCSPWKTLHKLFVISLLMIDACSYSWSSIVVSMWTYVTKIRNYCCCWSWSVSLWTCVIEMLYLPSLNPWMTLFCSYWLDLPCSWVRMTDLMCFSVLKTVRGIFIVSLLMICDWSRCWSWFVIWIISIWICVIEMMYLASRRFSMTMFCSHWMNLPWDWPHRTNVIYFSAWNTLQNTIIVAVLKIYPYSCCWGWSVIYVRTHATEFFYLSSKRLSMAVVSSYYLDINLIYHSTWWTLRKSHFVLL